MFTGIGVEEVIMGVCGWKCEYIGIGWVCVGMCVNKRGNLVFVVLRLIPNCSSNLSHHRIVLLLNKCIHSKGCIRDDSNS